MGADREAAIREWAENGGVFQREDGPVIVFPESEDVRWLLAELDATRERIAEQVEVIRTGGLLRQDILEKCPFCGHEWRQHDPEDGQCDSHAAPGEGIGVCKCGRDLGWMQVKIAALSSAALSEGEG